MKKQFLKMSLVALLIIVGATFCFSAYTFAEDDNEKTSQNESAEQTTIAGASISLTPVSKVLQISADSSYDDYFEIINNGDSDIKIEVYAAPYSYVYSEENDSYQLGFSNETKYTQISRWITIKNKNDVYEERPTFKIPAHDKIKIYYRIKTPSSIPEGGQYAVIFSHTVSDSSSVSGIRTEASPGLVVYGRSSEGKTVISAEISNMTIEQNITEVDTVRNNINASAKVKNTGNVDFTAVGNLKVEGLFGNVHYETPSNAGKISIIPEAELVVADEWKDTPSIGIFKVTWTVTVGEKTETIEKTVYLIPPFFVIFVIMLLTIIIVWIIIMVRKRKERHSRLAV